MKVIKYTYIKLSEFTLAKEAHREANDKVPMR